MITVHSDEKNGSVNGLKAANLRSIMCSLLCGGPQTKLDLLLSTGLSASTVSDLTNRLVQGKIVDDCGSEQSSGGRRPVIYHIRPAAGYMAGFALGEGRIDAVAADLMGTPVCACRFPLEKRAALDVLCAAVDWALAAAPGPVMAIGVGVRGLSRWETGVVLEDHGCNWRNVPLKEVLERRYGVPACVDHRVNARAVAEAYLGAAKNMRDFVCQYRDAPEKAALVSNGMLIRGHRGGAGKYHGKAEHLLALLDAETLVTDRQDLAFSRMIPARRTGPDFAPDCAVMAEIHWFDLLYDYLREGAK